MSNTNEDCRAPKGTGINAGVVAPFAMTIPAAQGFSGLSRSEIYRRMAAGDISAVKNGSRTLVLTESLRAYMSSLPQATFRAPKVSA
jgi:hypothetical protein